MDNKQVTAEWIAQQRESAKKIVQIMDDLCAGNCVPTVEAVDLAQDVADGAMSALDALEASMRREAEKEKEIKRLIHDYSTSTKRLIDEKDRLTAERDAEKNRADAVQEIDLRPLQPGYMGVCTTDDEDGIQIRKVSHKHPQGRGYLDDDEDVQDVVVIRFADTAQVLAVVDRLLVLADAMAEKTRTTSANPDAPTGAGSEGNNG